MCVGKGGFAKPTNRCIQEFNSPDTTYPESPQVTPHPTPDTSPGCHLEIRGSQDPYPQVQSVCSGGSQITCFYKGSTQEQVRCGGGASALSRCHCPCALQKSPKPHPLGSWWWRLYESTQNWVTFHPSQGWDWRLHPSNHTVGSTGNQPLCFNNKLNHWNHLNY